MEIYLHRNIALRAEAFYHESDLASASLNLVTRFGGRGALRLPDPPDLPTTIPSAELPPELASELPSEIPTDASSDVTESESSTTSATTPTPRSASGTESSAGELPSTTSAASNPQDAISGSSPNNAQPSIDDRDGDGVNNDTDVCARSAPGFPVRDNGCALFDGVLSGVQFADGSEALLPGAFEQLDFLVSVLGDYPQSRIELLAHTDDSGTVRDQSILTRARLKTVGTYLVRQGVRANRLVLRSFGGTRPLYDNRDDEGRRGNNRIEVIENTN